ncbi:MAG: hypothetical protein H7256_06125 [Bdellovibrio sp.]|nr:hypothetical protein [Bdellovibrio sp.]
MGTCESTIYNDGWHLPTFEEISLFAGTDNPEFFWTSSLPGEKYGFTLQTSFTESFIASNLKAGRWSANTVYANRNHVKCAH